jgi:hypothetical protein
MSFVLVSADCSCCKPEGRVEVYKLLSDAGWTRINGENNDTLSVWLGAVATHLPDEEAMEMARENFYSCFTPNCRPTIVFHWNIDGVAIAI